MSEKEEKKEEVAAEKEETFLGFNKELIPCKLIFFVLDASFSSLFSFLGLYYLSSGLTVTQLGLVNAIGSIFMLLAHPLWGGLVDSAIKHRTLLFVSLAMGTTVLEFGKPWLVMYMSKFQTVITCLGTTTASTVFNSTISNHSINHIGKNCTYTSHLMNSNTVFYAVVINGVFSSVVISGLMTYTEGAIIKTVFTRKTEHSYGEQKVFGPIGMALGSFIAGVAVDHYKPKHLSPFLAAFYVYLPFSLMLIPLLYILTKQAKWDYGTAKKDDERRKSLTEHVISSFRHRDNLMFVASVFIMGITSCIYSHYHYIYMYQTMNPSKTILSLTTVLSSVSELLVYPFSSKLIKLMGGHLRVMIIGCAMGCCRLVLFTFCKTPYWVLPLSLTGGVSSLIWTAMIEHTWAIFPKEMTTTAIGILVSFSWTGPSIISNIIGAILYHKFGGIKLLRGTAILAAFWFVMMILYFEIWRKGKAVSFSVTDTKVRIENGIEQKIHMEFEEEHKGKNVV